MIAVAALWLMAQAASPAGCDAMTLNAVGGLDTLPVPGLAEALATADLPLPKLPEKIAAVQCFRETLEPGPFDDRLLIEAGAPELYFTDPDGRIAALKLEGGRFVYTFPDGSPDPEPELAKVVNERLNAFEARKKR